MSQPPIKSVRRVFEILELFDEERRPLAAKEIAVRLNYPLVSAHALLKSMHQLGYLELGDRKWAYEPGRAFLERLEWTRDSLNEESTLLAFIDALNRETRETINLSRRTNGHVKIVRGLEARQAIGVSVKPGTEMPLTHSLTGLTALAATEHGDIDGFLEELRRVDRKQHEQFNRRRYLSILNEIQKTGAVCKTDLFIEGIGALCMPIVSPLTNRFYVVGVVGPTDRIKQQEREHRLTLKRLAREFGVKPMWKLNIPARN